MYSGPESIFCCGVNEPRLTFCIHSVVVVTNHSSIFSMIAITFTPAAMWTCRKRAFISCAFNFIQPYGSIFGTTKTGACSNVNSSWVPQHTAHYMCISYVPRIIAYRPPLAIVIKRHAALMWQTRQVIQYLDVYN